MLLTVLYNGNVWTSLLGGVGGDVPALLLFRAACCWAEEFSGAEILELFSGTGAELVGSLWRTVLSFEDGAVRVPLGTTGVVGGAWPAGMSLLSTLGAELELLLGIDVVEAWLVGTEAKVLVWAEGEAGKVAEETETVTTVVGSEDLSSIVRFRKSWPILSINILIGRKQQQANQYSGMFKANYIYM